MADLKVSQNRPTTCRRPSNHLTRVYTMSLSGRSHAALADLDSDVEEGRHHQPSSASSRTNNISRQDDIEDVRHHFLLLIYHY